MFPWCSDFTVTSQNTKFLRNQHQYIVKFDSRVSKRFLKYQWKLPGTHLQLSRSFERARFSESDVRVRPKLLNRPKLLAGIFPTRFPTSEEPPTSRSSFRTFLFITSTTNGNEGRMRVQFYFKVSAWDTLFLWKIYTLNGPHPRAKDRQLTSNCIQFFTVPMVSY